METEIYVIDGYNKEIVITDIGYNVTNVFIKYPNSNALVKVDVSYRVDGNECADTTYNTKWTIARDGMKLNLNTSTECKYIKITICSTGDLDIEKIIVNYTGVQFNLSRFIFIAFCVMAVLFLAAASKNFNYSIRKTTWILIAVNVVLFYLFASLEEGKIAIKLLDGIHINLKRYMDDYQELTYALANKSTHFINIYPSEELINLANPWDYLMRSQNGISYPFDASYYDGVYTTYFGIAPILMFLLPYYLLTGTIVYTQNTVIMFMMLYFALTAIVFGYAIKMFRARYKVSLSSYLIGYYLFTLGSGVLQTTRYQKYDLANISAIDCTLLSIILIFMLENGKFTKLKFMLLGFFMGMMVLSKPSFIIYYLLLIALCVYLKTYKKLKSIPNILCFGIPLGILAVIQMAYNYIRYDDIFQFGQVYQLGACAYVYNYFSIWKLLKALVAVIMSPPKFTPGVFPFFSENLSMDGIDQNMVSLCGKEVGLVFLPVLFIFVFAPRIMKKYADVTDKKTKLLVICMGMTSFILLCASVTAAAVNDEYLIDFRMVFMFIAFLLWMILISKDKSYNKYFNLCAFITLAVMIPCSLTYNFYIVTTFNRINVYLKSIFEVWA